MGRADDAVVGKTQTPDLSNAQANIQAASKTAGAYFSSWGTWASEKRKGWGNKTPVSSPPPTDVKREQAFAREKQRSVGDIETPGSEVREDDGKRESLFFDAERSEDKIEGNT